MMMNRLECKVWDRKRKQMYGWGDVSSIRGNGEIEIELSLSPIRTLPVGTYKLLRPTGAFDEDEQELFDRDIVEVTLDLPLVGEVTGLGVITWEKYGWVVMFLSSSLGLYEVLEHYGGTFKKVGNYFSDPDIWQK